MEPETFFDKVTWVHFQSTSVIWSKNFFELHARVKKCHSGNFSERAGMAVLFTVIPLVENRPKNQFLSENIS